MDAEEGKKLLEYRKQIITDAVRMKKRPDRTPHIANFWTWMVLDQGYTLTEALVKKPHLFADSEVAFQEKYQFDMGYCDGLRNWNYIAEPLGASLYAIDDVKGLMNVADGNAYWMEAGEYDEYIANPAAFQWTKFLKRKFASFNESLTEETMREVIRRFNECMIGGVNADLDRRLLELGCVGGQFSTTLYMNAMETVMGDRGLRGMSADMHRDKEALKRFCDFCETTNNAAALAAAKDPNYVRPERHAFDFMMSWLVHNFLNRKQFEEYIWPYLKQYLDAIVETDKICFIFSEGSTKQYWDYLKDLPAGHFAMHVEQDDVFEFRNALPNIAIVGGMPTTMLGTGTAKDCVDYAKYLIDELGDTGFLLSQDKMVSYKADANPENVLAVCDFVNNYHA